MQQLLESIAVQIIASLHFPVILHSQWYAKFPVGFKQRIISYKDYSTLEGIRKYRKGWRHQVCHEFVEIPITVFQCQFNRASMSG
jgi:hypothetical protein